MKADQTASSLRSVLVSRGLPEAVFQAWEDDGLQSLLPIQQMALSQDALFGTHAIVLGPTSSGKTFVGEVLAIHHALKGRKCIYIVPFKALAEEKYAEFSNRYGRDGITANVIISTADRREHDRLLIEADFDIAVVTYEKLAAIMTSHPRVVQAAGLLVVDELQLISDAGRGPELELLLTRCRQLAPECQIVALSAVASNLAGTDDWLGAVVIRGTHRPVPLREGVLNSNGLFKYQEWTSDARVSGEEQIVEIPTGDSMQRAVILVRHLLSTNPEERVLVFAPTVADTQRLAELIAGHTEPLPEEPTLFDGLLNLEPTVGLETLQGCLKQGIAFHNADLTLEERRIVEAGFRNGHVRCIVSTSTLSMGMNLPASTVVIVSPTKWTKAGGRWAEVPISVAEYRNMSGRAGRLGHGGQEVSRSILIAKSTLEQQGLLNRYVAGADEPIHSALGDYEIASLVLRVMASGLAETEDDLREFFLATLAAVQRWRDRGGRKELEQSLSTALNVLVTECLVSGPVTKKYKVTALGVACASSGFRVPDFVRIVSAVKDGVRTAGDVALLTAACAASGPDGVGLRFSSAELSRTRQTVARIREALLEEDGPTLEAFLDRLPTGTITDYDVGRSLKFQLIALAYVHGIASKDIEIKCDVSAGKARQIGGMCSWICDTAARVAWVLELTEAAKAFELLSDRYLHGCSVAAIPLARVASDVHRSELEKLVAAGYDSLQQVVDESAIQMAQAARVNRQRVESLQSAIVRFMGESLERDRMHLTRLRRLGRDVRLVEALYTATGTQLEQAVENLLVEPFCPLTVRRITRQRDGEADLRFRTSGGEVGVIQVTAKQRPADRVGLSKAGAVLQQSPDLTPKVFVCIGRPDFDDAAKRQALLHAQAGRNYKAIPVHVLAEMYVQFEERTITSERVAEVLETETGVIGLDRI